MTRHAADDSEGETAPSGDDDLAVETSGLRALRTKAQAVHEALVEETRKAATATNNTGADLTTHGFELAGALQTAQDSWETRRGTLSRDLRMFDQDVETAANDIEEVETATTAAISSVSQALMPYGGARPSDTQ